MNKFARNILLLASVGLLAAAGGVAEHMVLTTTISNAQSGTKSMTATQTSTLALGSASYGPSVGSTISWSNGTGAGQVNLMWSDTSTVAASAADTVRLRGTEVDPFGNVINFGAVKSLTIVCKATNTNDIIIGNAADSTWVGPMGSATHTISCKPGEQLSWAMANTGYPVTAATKKLKIMNGAGGSTVFYTIMLFGTT